MSKALVRSIVPLSTLFLYMSYADATGYFFCTANGLRNEAFIGANIGYEFDSLPLMPPTGSPEVVLSGKSVNLRHAAVSIEQGWTVIRSERKGHLVIAYRKSGEDPIFLPDRDYKFCNIPNWKDNCWSAQIRYPKANGKLKVIKAVCGIG